MESAEKDRASDDQDLPEQVDVARALEDSGPGSLEVYTRRFREWMRGGVALVLLGILLGEIMASAIMMFVWNGKIADIKGWLDITLGPTIGLVGPVIGFYFSSDDR